LYKNLLKSKRVVESGLLPDYVKVEGKGDWSEEELLAVSNVTARMYNTKFVKESMADIFSSIYGILGIPQPGASPQARKNTAEDSHTNSNGRLEASSEADSTINGSARAQSGDDEPRGESPAWEGFNSGSGPDLDSGEAEYFSRYDGLVAGSSDNESSEAIHSSDEINRPPTALQLRSNSRKAISVSSDLEESRSHFVSPQRKKTKPTNNTAKQESQTISKQTSTPTSTFLPTLMGGYWSGSEDLTDVNDDDDITRGDAAPRKNRRGQQARRAIWEKKFGAKANHLKANGPAKVSDRDWDPRRGARTSAEMAALKEGKGRGHGIGGRKGGVRGRGRGGTKAGHVRGTGENAIAVKPRAGRGQGERGGEGKKKDADNARRAAQPLHPSWEAARKAKEAKVTAPFQGKKVVFE
jgi:BUD22